MREQPWRENRQRRQRAMPSMVAGASMRRCGWTISFEQRTWDTSMARPSLFREVFDRFLESCWGGFWKVFGRFWGGFRRKKHGKTSCLVESVKKHNLLRKPYNNKKGETATTGDRFVRKMATYGQVRPSVSFTSESCAVFCSYLFLVVLSCLRASKVLKIV